MDHLLHTTASESTYYAPPHRKSLLRTTTFCNYRKPPDPFIYPHFLCTTCVASWLFVPWKKCWWGFMSRSYFTSCPSENTDFRQTRTCKKTTDKYRKHLLRRASDFQKKNCRVMPEIIFRRWQVPLAVKSSTWQTSQLVKLTCQVNLTNHHISTSVGPWSAQEWRNRTVAEHACSKM